MRTTTEIINGEETTVIHADQGKELVMIHNGMRLGGRRPLGVDYSTGKARQDRPEYYKEVTVETDLQPTEQ